MELKAKARRLVHGSLSPAILRHNLLLITLLHLLGDQASAQATGVDAQHVAGIDTPRHPLQLHKHFSETTKFNTPNNQG